MIVLKNVLCIFVAASLLSACSDQADLASKADHEKIVQPQIDPKLAAWVGEYSGVIPCVGCVSRCPDCESMAIDLEIMPDMKFKLTQTSLSTHNEPQVLTGSFSFLDEGRLQVELADLQDRGKLILGSNYIEIIDTKSDQPYQAYQDFRIYKQV